MTAPLNFYADFNKLAELKGTAKQQEGSALRETARQFESLFTQMMLKTMREASESLSSGESMMDNDQSKMYREMFDNQIAMQLSKGRGLGLADMLVRQLANGAVPAGKDVEKSQGGGQSFPIKPVSTSVPEFKPVPNPVNSQNSGAAEAPRQPAHSDVKRPESASGAASVDKESASKSTAVLRTPLADSREKFIAQMLPHAEAAAKELGVDAKTLIAHAALETGWGKFVPCNPDGTCSFNLFGIKATGKVTDSWNGAATAVNTIEYDGGVATQRRESFRAYESPADSFRDYAALLKSSKRYASALGAGDNARAFASALQNGGYATDPNYADKLAATATALKNFLSAPLVAGEGVTRGGSRT